MLAKFKKVSTYVGAGIGGLSGVLDNVAANHDAKAITDEVATGKKLNMLKQWGTYVNYIVPAVEILAVGYMDRMPDGLGEVMIATSTQLLASKAMRNMTTYPFGKKKSYQLSYLAAPSPYTAERPSRQIIYTPTPNAPVVTAAAVPVVTPQGGMTGIMT